MYGLLNVEGNVLLKPTSRQLNLFYYMLADYFWVRLEEWNVSLKTKMKYRGIG